MTNANPLISIVITCYNQSKYIEECLKSVVSQTFKYTETIVVDDGSTDNSLEIISSFKDKIHNLKIISQENSGVIKARNIGIKNSCGDYIYTLDGDDYIADKTLEILYEAINKGQGDVVTSNAKCFGVQNYPIFFYPINKLNMSGINCLLNAALFKREDFIRSGGYDKAFNDGFEDYDLWLNFLFNLNLKFYRVPDYLYFYRLKTANESRNYSASKKEQKLIDLLKTKYPKLRYYKFLYNLRNFFYNKRYSVRRNCYVYTFFKIIRILDREKIQ